jgi:Alternative complex III, ActD subunit
MNNDSRFTFHDSRGLYGIMAEFAQPEQLLAATRAAYQAGYRKMEAYTPYSVEGVAEALGFTKTRVPLIVLLGGIAGALTAYGMEWFSAVVDYPLNVGGRPLHSWPAFIPITFELTVLFAAIAGLIGMLWLNGLPKPYHPVFNAPEFRLASQTRFFLCIEADDRDFDLEKVRQFLRQQSPLSVVEVEK